MAISFVIVIVAIVGLLVLAGLLVGLFFIVRKLMRRGKEGKKSQQAAEMERMKIDDLS